MRRMRSRSSSEATTLPVSSSSSPVTRERRLQPCAASEDGEGSAGSEALSPSPFWKNGDWKNGVENGLPPSPGDVERLDRMSR